MRSSFLLFGFDESSRNPVFEDAQDRKSFVSATPKYEKRSPCTDHNARTNRPPPKNDVDTFVHVGKSTRALSRDDAFPNAFATQARRSLAPSAPCHELVISFKTRLCTRLRKWLRWSKRIRVAAFTAAASRAIWPRPTALRTRHRLGGARSQNGARCTHERTLVAHHRGLRDRYGRSSGSRRGEYAGEVARNVHDARPKQGSGPRLLSERCVERFAGERRWRNAASTRSAGTERGGTSARTNVSVQSRFRRAFR